MYFVSVICVAYYETTCSTYVVVVGSTTDVILSIMFKLPHLLVLVYGRRGPIPLPPSVASPLLATNPRRVICFLSIRAFSVRYSAFRLLLRLRQRMYCQHRCIRCVCNPPYRVIFLYLWGIRLWGDGFSQLPSVVIGTVDHPSRSLSLRWSLSVPVCCVTICYGSDDAATISWASRIWE